MKSVLNARVSILIIGASLTLAACGGIKSDDYYPDDGLGDTDSTMRTESAQEEGGLFSGKNILGGLSGSKEPTGLGVNSFLWRATLDTLSFMPLTTADPTGGVVITDWHANPQVPAERFKLTVYILDTRLRADGVKVSVFRQEKVGNDWQDAAVNASTAVQLENQILRRARELKVGVGE